MTVCSEFNFFSDPEAAKIVLTQLEGPITVIGMDPCYENALTWVIIMQSLDLSTVDNAIIIPKLIILTISCFSLIILTPIIF